MSLGGYSAVRPDAGQPMGQELPLPVARGVPYLTITTSDRSLFIVATPTTMTRRMKIYFLRGLKAGRVGMDPRPVGLATGRATGQVCARSQRDQFARARLRTGRELRREN